VLLLLGAGCLSEFVAFIRPQLATFALFAATLFILRDHWDRPQSRWIWALPPMFAAWVNLHGGFLAGGGVLAVFVGGWIVRDVKERLSDCRTVGLSEPIRAAGANSSDSLKVRQSESRRFALGTSRSCIAITAVALLSAAATILNPYGATMHAMLWDHLIPEQAVREWQPLWGVKQAAAYYVPFVMLLLALPGWRRLRWIDAAVIAVVGWQAVSHIRHVSLLCITAMILLPAPLSVALPRLMNHPLS